MPQQVGSGFDASTARLNAAVGPGQPNNREDVLTIQRLLNVVLGSRRVQIGRLPETGTYDQRTQDAIRKLERLYFNAMADAFHRIEPDDESFCYLKYAAVVTTAVLSPHITNEMYELAAKMVPGGADKLVNARPKRAAASGASSLTPTVVLGSIRTFLPDILKALDERDIADLDMVLMAFATIRAETAGFRPIPEGVSKWNTTLTKKTKEHPKQAPVTHAFDKYDNRAKSLGNLGAPDGAAFKGRGFVQLTGRANYENVGKQIGQDLVKNSELANDPRIAAAILAQFLKNKETDIRSALAHGNLAYARKLVNGGSHGRAEFISAFNSGRQFLKLAIIVQAKKAAAPKKAASTPASKVAPKAAAPKSVGAG